MQAGPAPDSTLAFPSLDGRVSALVVGAGGAIGRAIVRRLAASAAVERVWAASRAPGEPGSGRVTPVALDVTDEASIERAAGQVAAEGGLNLVVNCAGLLHRPGGLQPERRLEDVRQAWLAESFAVNATGVLLLARHFAPLLPRRAASVFASLSARVGSIGDNRLGGWYAYRAAKAAQNMILKTLSRELPRRARGARVVALHPGTTDTALSQPFRASIPPDRLFSPDFSAARLLAVIGALGPADNGLFLAWDGRPIPW